MINCKFQIANCKLQIANCDLATPIQNPKSKIQNRRARRPAFTLPELLITIAIISLLAGLGLAALGGATELAREQRTQAMIDKIDQFIRERYEDYRTRPVPIRIPAGMPPQIAARARLIALRDLMRMELPDRMSDVLDNPCDYDPTSGQAFLTPPSLFSGRTGYRSRVKPGWTSEYQGAECLYLIIGSMRDGDKRALEYFAEDEIDDVDKDGMNEIVDGWGTPIEFVRWPAGYTTEQPGADGEFGVASVDDDGNSITDDITEWSVLNASSLDFELVNTLQTRNAAKAPDPFDPIKMQVGMYTPNANGYLLHPLVISAGPDRSFDVLFDIDVSLGGPFRYSPPGASGNNSPNPYVRVPARLNATASPVGVPIGTVGDLDGNGEFGFNDNLSNHAQRAQ